MIWNIAMAQKRMINKKISVSERIAELGEKGALLFTWMIPHTDDMGLLPYSPRSIKALVVPMLDYSVDEVAGYLSEMKERALIREFHYEEKAYWRMMGFESEQTGLKKDRQPFTLLDIKLSENPKESWKILLRLMDSKWIPNGTVLVPEEKRREEKLNTVSINGDEKILKNLPDSSTDEDYVKHIVEFMRAKLRDNHSDKYFRLVAMKLPENWIRQTISEIIVDGADDYSKVFAFRVNKFVLNLKFEV